MSAPETPTRRAKAVISLIGLHRDWEGRLLNSTRQAYLRQLLRKGFKHETWSIYLTEHVGKALVDARGEWKTGNLKPEARRELVQSVSKVGLIQALYLAMNDPWEAQRAMEQAISNLVMLHERTAASERRLARLLKPSGCTDYVPWAATALRNNPRLLQEAAVLFARAFSPDWPRATTVVRVIDLTAEELPEAASDVEEISAAEFTATVGGSA